MDPPLLEMSRVCFDSFLSHLDPILRNLPPPSVAGTFLVFLFLFLLVLGIIQSEGI